MTKKLIQILGCIFLLTVLTGGSGWAQQCTEDTQLARLSPAMLGSVSVSTDPCAGCTYPSGDSKIVDNGNVGRAAYGSTVAYRGRWFKLEAATCITSCFAEGYDGGNGATMTCAIYHDDESTNCGNNVNGCPDSGHIVVSASAAVNVPDAAAEYEIPFSSTQNIPAGTYHLVFHLGGTTTGHNWMEDNLLNNYTTSYSADGTSWSPSNGDTVNGAYGCAQ